MEEKAKKPTSFRIDDETAEKFKGIANNIGGNQQETMSVLIQAYELQKGKVALQNKKDDIEKFENYVTILIRMYMNSLEDNQHLEDNVRAAFDAQLKSKDQSILELQEKTNMLNEMKKSAFNDSETAKKESEELSQLLSKIKKEFEEKTTTYQKMLTDKEELNKALAIANNEQQHKIEAMGQEVAKAKEVQARTIDLEQQVTDYKRVNNDLEKQLMDNKTAYDKALEEVQKQAEFEHKQELFELKKKYEEEIQELKTKKLKEMNEYQEMHLDLLKRLSKESSE